MLFSAQAIKCSARYPSESSVIKWHICLVAVTIQEEQTKTYKERTLPMRNPQLYVAAIVIGVLALIVGIMLLANMFGTHHTLPYLVLVVGAILVIAGIVGIVSRRSRSVV